MTYNVFGWTLNLAQLNSISEFIIIIISIVVVVVVRFFNQHCGKCIVDNINTQY